MQTSIDSSFQMPPRRSLRAGGGRRDSLQVGSSSVTKRGTGGSKRGDSLLLQSDANSSDVSSFLNRKLRPRRRDSVDVSATLRNRNSTGKQQRRRDSAAAVIAEAPEPPLPHRGRDSPDAAIEPIPAKISEITEVASEAPVAKTPSASTLLYEQRLRQRESKVPSVESRLNNLSRLESIPDEYEPDDSDSSMSREGPYFTKNTNVATGEQQQQQPSRHDSDKIDNTTIKLTKSSKQLLRVASR